MSLAEDIAVYGTTVGAALTVAATLTMQIVNFIDNRRERSLNRERDFDRQRVEGKIDTVAKAVDGQGHALNAAIAGKNFAEGKEAGIKEERADPQSSAPVDSR